MKKWLTIAACILVPVTVFAGQPTQEDILNKIDAMQKQIVAQQAEIHALKGMLEQNTDQVEMVRQEVDAAVEEGAFAQIKAGGDITIPDHISNLDITGGLNLRFDYGIVDDDNVAGGEETVEAFSHDLRLGGVWTSEDEAWKVAVGIMASCADRTDARMSNDTWNDLNTDTGNISDINLDYAYVTHLFEEYCTTLTLGQQINPLTCTWLSCDPDLRPAGATLEYRNEAVFGILGAYNLMSGQKTFGATNQSLAYMYVAQIGATLGNEEVSGTLAASYMYIDSEVSEYLRGFANDDNERSIVGLYGDVSGMVGEVGLKAYGEVGLNLGAEDDDQDAQGNGGNTSNSYDNEDEDMAWILGLQAKSMGVGLHYAYAVIEGDSVPWFLTDSDFTLLVNGVNVEGHVFGATYDVTKNCQVGATVILTEGIDMADGKEKEGELYRVEVSYNF